MPSRSVRFAPAIRRQLEERLAGRPSWVVLVELFLGFGWMRAAVEKLLSPRWWGGDPIREFAAANADETLWYYRPVIEHIITPTITLVAVATVVLQLFIALTILSGHKLAYGLLAATALNLNIMVAGGVNPSIFYLILQAALGLWLVESGSVGAAVRAPLVWVRRAAAVVFVTALPFVGTLQPKNVIEDPGAVLATYGACMAVAASVGLRGLLAEPKQ